MSGSTSGVTRRPSLSRICGHRLVDDRVARARGAGHAAGGDDHRAGRAGGCAAAMAVGQPSGLDRHVHAPADAPGTQVRDELEVDLGRRALGCGGAWRPPWPGRARGLPGRGVGVAVGSGGAAVGVSVGVGVGFGASLVVGQSQRRDGEARAEQHHQDGGDGEQRAAGVLHAPARGDEQPLPQQVERIAGLAGLRVALDELGDADRRGRRCVFVVAQHAAVDRDALGLRQPGERLGQVGPAAFGDRAPALASPSSERRQADPLARGVRHLRRAVRPRRPRTGRCPATTRSPGPCAARAGAGARSARANVSPTQVEQHVRLPRAAPEIRGHGPDVAFVELAERLRVVAPQQLGVRPHVLQFYVAAGAFDPVRPIGTHIGVPVTGSGITRESRPKTA